MPVIDIHHVAVKTADVERTVRFYNKVLGTRTVPRPDFPFPGAWLSLGSTMFHLYGGNAAMSRDGTVPTGGAAVDHIALTAKDFDAMRRVLQDRALDWRENDIPSAGLWQLFVHDPNGVLIELNFPVAAEPKGAKGPDGTRVYKAGEF
jgi:catechol 2,3-dioxygenase-like lactoylglutathione lyase family enzyme